MERLFITCNAAYGINPETEEEFLTRKGLESSHSKALNLRIRFQLGQDAVLLSSTSRPAVLTAREIRRELHIPKSLKAPCVETVGNFPEKVQNLHDFTARVLEESGVDYKGRNVILVTEQPLVDAISTTIGDGVTFVPEWWQNPGFEPEQAIFADGAACSLNS